MERSAQIDYWVILSLLAAFLWAVVNLLDKTLVITYIRSQWTRLILDSIVGLLTAITLLAMGLVEDVDNGVVFLGVLAGFLLVVFNYLYYRALEIADVSSTSALLQTIPVWTALWGFVFLGETFSLIVYLGIVLVVLGAIFVGFQSDDQGGRTIFRGQNWKAAVFFTIPAVMIVSANYIIQKYLLSFTNNWTVFFWGRIGAFALIGVAWLISERIRQDFAASSSEIRAKPLAMVFAVEWLNLAGIFLSLTAYSIGPVTLVATLTAVQPLFVILLSLIVGLFLGRPLLGDFSSSLSVLLVRIVATLILLIGVYLVLSGYTF